MQEFISHNLKHIKLVFEHNMSKSNTTVLRLKNVEDTQQQEYKNSISNTIQNRSHIQRMLYSSLNDTVTLFEDYTSLQSAPGNKYVQNTIFLRRRQTAGG